MSAYDALFSTLLTANRGESERRRLTQKLHSFASLPRGWSHGEGLPISMESIGRADLFVFFGSDLGLHADVFPNVDGGCAVAFYNEAERLEISISSDGRNISMRRERGIGFQFEDVYPPVETVSPRTAADEVLRLSRDKRWSLLVSSTYASSTGVQGASAMLYFDILPGQPIPVPLRMVVGGSQSSKRLVPA